MKHITALIAIVSVLIGLAALPVRANIPEGGTQFFTPVPPMATPTPTRRAENIEQVTSITTDDALVYFTDQSGLHVLGISDPFDRSVDGIIVRGGPIYLVASNGELVVLKSDFQADVQ